MLSTIENHYERMVVDRIFEVLSERDEPFDAAYCDDLACVALNRLPPRYRRFSIDLVSHMNDAEQAIMQEQVTEAVAVAFETIQRRQDLR